VKRHIVVTVARALADDATVPYWVTFVNDKSFVRETFTPEVDRLMREIGMRFWLTKEYSSAGDRPTSEEVNAGLDRTYRMILQEDYAFPPDLVAQIRLLPEVESARAIGVSESALPALSTQASLPAMDPGALIGLPYARLMTKGLPEVHVAVLDTGVDLNHPELRGKVQKRADFVNLEGLDTTGFVGDFRGYDVVPMDEVGHGSHVAGIIAGAGRRMNEGVAPVCSLMAVRVLATMKQGDRYLGAGVVDNINTGIKWAVDNGAHVINMSLGIRHVGGGLPHQDVIRYALSKNVTVVAASGNDGTSERYYPGALEGVVAVGAVDGAGQVAGFSSYGANIFVVAPGVDVYSSFARNGYAVASGTSQAAPFVSGAVALLKSYALEHGHSLANQDVAGLLKHTSDKVDSRLRHRQAGYGLINLEDAFRMLNHWLR
jgi:thermitase